MSKFLVTGGAGYIGSHMVLYLLQSGYDVVVLDNFCNSSAESLRRIQALTGKTIDVVEGDIRDKALLSKVFSDYEFEAVLHFAGLKSVAESVKEPLLYYSNNLTGTATLCEAMREAGVFRLVFSSSATVYGDPEQVPISEDLPTGVPTNAYGRTKLMVEQMLADLARTDSRWEVALLRYFNPVGAHESGLIGEDPAGIPNNLLPYITQVAVGKLAQLSVYGGDYPTVDGTGVRDYIHVVDLVAGHLSALNFIAGKSGVHVWNLGTGVGYSVLQMVVAFEKASGKKIPYKIVERRPGDIAECWANPEKAAKELGWKTERNLDQMMLDSWNWQSKNPNGYLS